MEKYSDDVIFYEVTNTAKMVQDKITLWIEKHPYAKIEHVIPLPGYDINGTRRILILYHTDNPFDIDKMSEEEIQKGLRLQR